MRALVPMLLGGVLGCGPSGDDPRPTPTDTHTGPADTDVPDLTDTGEDSTSLGLGALEVQGVAVARPEGSDVLRGPDLAVLGQTVIVSWVVVDDAQVGVLHVARSTDGGQTFGAPLEVVTPMSARSDWPRHPRIAIDDSRVAVAVEGEVDYERGEVGLYAGPADGPLALEPLRHLEPAYPYDSFLYPLPVFSPAGDLWLTWVGGMGLDADALVAREEEGWAVERPNATEDQPCECCPTDLVFAPDGDAVMAWRGDYVRDIHVLRARPPGRFEQGEVASDNRWKELACPQDGPRVQVDEAGTTWVAFSDASLGVMQGWLVSRPVDGAWSVAARPVPDVAIGQTRPTLAVSGRSTIRVGLELGWGGPYAVVRSDDGGATWTAPLVLTSPGGPLSQARLLDTVGGVRAIGIGEDDGAVWLVELH